MSKGATRKLIQSRAFQDYHAESRRKLEVLVQMEKICRELGWAQTELAQKMDLRQNDISNILNGKRNFTFNILDKFCQATNQEITRV